MSEDQEQPLFSKGTKTENKKFDDKKSGKKSSKKTILISAIAGGIVLIGGIILLIVLLTQPDTLTCTRDSEYYGQKFIIEFGGQKGISKITMEQSGQEDMDSESDAREAFDEFRSSMRESIEDNDSNYISGLGRAKNVRIKVDNDREFSFEGVLDDASDMDGTLVSARAMLNGKSVKRETSSTITGSALDEMISELKDELEDSGITGGITKENVRKNMEGGGIGYVCE